MDEKLQFVARRLAGESMAEVGREFGISRKTGYQIFNQQRPHEALDMKCPPKIHHVSGLDPEKIGRGERI